MCGIAGYCGSATREWLITASEALKHRGPDAEGTYVDPHDKAGLAHRRLSILDLSDAGRQPMSTPDGRYTITYNGEIYNFRELRPELEARGHRFRSTSDTEVLLAAWAEWGEACLNKLNGIFAFAIWDSTNSILTLVRDPLGVKPLYWALAPSGTLYFASELTCLLARENRRELNPCALDAYLAFLWIPAPLTLFKSIYQLKPGYLLSLKAGESPKVRLYTNLFDLIREPARALIQADEVWSMLQTCVQRQLISDVPVGVFLSGGLDSTGIIAACKDRSALTAYTIAFSERDSAFEATSNDLAFAQDAARFFRIRHEILHVEPDITRLLPKYLASMDQPVGDHAPLASYLICQAASARAKVLLSGQGADEIFAGYPWHRAGVYSKLYHRLPGPLRKALLEPLIDRLPGGSGGKWLGNLRRLKRFSISASLPWPDRYVGFCRYLEPGRRNDLLVFAGSLDGWNAETIYAEALREAYNLSFVNQMLFADLKTFLPGLNLFYTDRTGMAHGVEVRVPYLDLEMVRLAFSIPDRQKINYLSTKIILKNALKSHIPESVIRRKKAGFGLPVRSWMRNGLSSLLQQHLSGVQIRKRGIWNPHAVQTLLDEQQSGKEDRAYLLFALLSLEIWLQIHLDRQVAG